MDEIVRILLANSAAGVAVAALILGIVTPKVYYDREVKRADLATEDNREMRKSLTVVTDAMKVLAQAVADLKTELISIKEQLKDSQEETRKLREELLRSQRLGGA